MTQLAAFFGALLAAASAVHGYTVVDSGFLMRKNIDPIVVPGQYKSHMHSFFGSDAVNVNTTTSEELRAGCHTNGNPNDYSIYCMFVTPGASLGTCLTCSPALKGPQLCSQ